MEKITFSIIINAPRETVWDTMLGKETYKQWAAAFSQGSTYEGSWDEGSEIKFTSPSEDGSAFGMYALVAANRPHEFVSIKHLGEFKGSERMPMPVHDGQEVLENYTFKDVEGGTEVVVDLTIPAEWAGMFNEMWPKALSALKALAEKNA
jgi:uncharacterized protein YndB with AHSA1/START domain